MIKACVFDLDGTLCDTLTTISYFGNETLKAFGLNEIEINEYKYMIGKGYKNLIRNMLNYLNVYTEELYSKSCDYYFNIYDKDPLYLTSLYDGIAQMLDTLKEKGVKIAVLSNKPDNATKNVVEKFMGKWNFEHAQGNIEGVPLKPDPTSLLSILDVLGVKKDECLYIGDTSTDIETGKNAGLKTVGVLWGFRTEKELKDSGADFIAASPEDISALI